MPIVEIEIVAADPDSGNDRIQLLTDELGDLFGTEPGTTWVRLRRIDPDHYAENKTVVDRQHLPTFVNIQHYELPEATELRLEASRVASVVAQVFGRSREYLHVLYSSSAKGRIGFGGELR